ncbi:MAG: ribonuclease III [Candidatus Lloydbacteria bacterium RIFCSPHIGHO2_01_FULL_49_22]|uniref:Ribonuclease 3 n=1 Tax=Candidatus Lloydbacteria bacterium RIFCSPHIGHO2_01_FULL_49_22 TaxID=1798658 RepID=A0A1G2CZ34_9BACT|nr:MAG: ribonuclease III [Candidatus Lloydbacteria bacterium RIFCSPHIGHO2_01_FULL_49_22]OGZ09054.1 MAG: ribonuclease III [Candidatus Lloydbacteria bacterium RIFCSPHIGHO2_02_FULL_50_18]
MDNNLAEYEKFATEIGVTFKDLTLLREAFTHRSYLNEHRGTNMKHNERLEFLGDAVLELVMTEYLFAQFPEEPEGRLTAYRSALVNTDSISRAASDWNMNEYLLLSRGETKDMGRARSYILANTFEAVIGSIFLDQGYDGAKDFIARSLFNRLDEIVGKRLWQDAKSRFQEEAQERTGITPNYEVLKETGPDHDKRFEVGVYLGSDLVASGLGASKQDAEQIAAQSALDKKGWHETIK